MVFPYIAGADGETRTDTLYLGAVINAIYNALDGSINFTNVTMTIDGTVYSSFQFGNVPARYGMYPYHENLITP